MPAGNWYMSERVVGYAYHFCYESKTKAKRRILHMTTLVSYMCASRDKFGQIWCVLWMFSGGAIKTLSPDFTFALQNQKFSLKTIVSSPQTFINMNENEHDHNESWACNIIYPPRKTSSNKSKVTGSSPHLVNGLMNEPLSHNTLLCLV